MKNNQVTVTRKGGPEVLEIVEGKAAEPQSGEVRVKIQATGVAFADVMMRYGLYPGAPKPPFVLGYDIAGIVDKVGAEITDFAVGQAVVALTVRGGNAQYICLRAEELVPAPPGLDPAESTSVVLNYVTAYQLLHRHAHVKRGERVLIHSAAGGVGTALLQLARHAGLECFGTASASKHDIVKKEGATPIDYKTKDFEVAVKQWAKGGVDAVFDGIGGTNLRRSYRCLRKGGRLVSYGFQSSLNNGRTSMMTLVSGMVVLGFLGLIPDGRKAVFYSITDEKKKHENWFREDLIAVLGLLADGKIHPVIAQRLPLLEAVRAHEIIENGSMAGKVVLLCDSV